MFHFASGMFLIFWAICCRHMIDWYSVWKPNTSPLIDSGYSDVEHVLQRLVHLRAQFTNGEVVTGRLYKRCGNKFRHLLSFKFFYL